MKQLRITSGLLRNKKLKVGKNTSPLRERIKLAIFSIIGTKVTNAVCLDLFAGSGNLGLEALSRGAKYCTFVDNDFNAIEALRENVKNLTNTNMQLSEMTKIVKSDAVKFIVNDPTYYDIIFIDPPYKQPVKHIFKFIHETLHKNGIIIYLHIASENIPIEKLTNKLEIIDQRKYGITAVDLIVYNDNTT